MQIGIRRRKGEQGTGKTRWGRNSRLTAAGVFLLAAAGVMQLAARQIAGFGEWYATTVYPYIVGIYGRICGVFPFSVVEIAIYSGIIWIIWKAAAQIRRMTGRAAAGGSAVNLQAKDGAETLPASDPAEAGLGWLGTCFSGGCFFLGLLAFLYTACCGVNYYRRPFSSYLNLDVRESSVEELTALCEYLTEKVNETVDDTPYSAAWNTDARRAMSGLARQYPQLAGGYPRPKGLWLSWILSVQQLSGVYSPFTVEANYNRDMTDYNIPHTICHELSHLRGFMREDEANFIGYLACIQSDSKAFCYSGYLTGWVYAGNALAAQDPETYYSLYGLLNEKTKSDLRENNAFWDRYEGKVAEVSNQMNDVYLKINDQQDGVKSYGRMVDLMLAYYR